MANNVTATKEATKRTFTCSFFREDMTHLIQLSTLVTGHNLDEFRKTYGHILYMLTSHVDEWALYTLLQFYDFELRCFTFRDYQLPPTLEEYAGILKIKVQRKIPFVCVPEKPKMDRIAGALYLSMKDVTGNWKPNGGTHGFHVKFLIKKADALAVEKKWKEFNALLAVMIYGLVLFPNIPNFVDLTIVCLFMDQNPVPTLLGDTYYTIHSRYGKKGSVGGCLPLLYEWFTSHLPKIGPFVTMKDSQKWPQRIMGLTANDIVWCPIGMGIEEVITSCDKPLDKEIFESVCFEKGTDPKGLEKVRSAWDNIHTDDQTSLGEKNAVAKQAYTDWVKDRVKDRLFPFPKVNPLYEQPPEVLTTAMPTENCIQVDMESTQLHEKRSDTQLKHYLVDQEKTELTHEAKMLKGGSSRVQKKARTEKGERDTTVVVEDHQKIIKGAIKEAEEKLKREYREYLKAYKLKIEREARAEVKSQKKKLEEETTQRIAVETQLKGSHLRTTRLTEENAKLKDQMMGVENAPEKAYLLECKGCDELRECCKNLDGQLFRKDVVIQSFVKGRDR
ncbi:uncharacterized protein LOC131659259 [Vicia villosa]|uniref:uncharacterized protein LOC131659259 n=1 Tax=Vicia villosa TaxID=3911 RepID=UPI00273B5D34|nr:uncharacterized protein LOC131659259 [Vicia villosa]